MRMLERRAIIARRLVRTSRAGIASSPAYPVTTWTGGMEEDSESSGQWSVASDRCSGFWPSFLTAGFDYQDHSWVEDGYVAIVALESCDRGLVGGGDRVEGFAVLHGVVEDGALAGGVFVGGVR